MGDFQQQAVRLAAQQDTLPWLADLKAEAITTWLAQPWPTRTTEHWKYTPLQSLKNMLPGGWETTAEMDGIAPNFIPLDAIRLVFINGIFSAEHSSSLHPHIVRFSAADAAQQTVIQTYLNKIVEGSQHLFATLNNAWLDDGLLVHVPVGEELKKPLYLVQISRPTDVPVSCNQRLLIVLEANSKAKIVEHFISTDQVQNSFVNALTEINLGANASLEHYRLNLEEENAQHIGAVHVNLWRDARFRGFTLALGARLMRIDYQLNHRGPGAHIDLQGVYLPRHKQMVDYHTNICHWVPHCTSNEIFRGIIADFAQAIFNGRIYIHPQAQKTVAELSNKNLLTSNKAEVNTKPELEIYADDVKCAHGATISQLNANSRYYLQSRGLSRTEAEVILSFGFINELLQNIVEPAVQEYLVPRLAALFGRDSLFVDATQE